MFLIWNVLIHPAYTIPSVAAAKFLLNFFSEGLSLLAECESLSIKPMLSLFSAYIFGAVYPCRPHSAVLLAAIEPPGFACVLTLYPFSTTYKLSTSDHTLNRWLHV
jgi:hypothetical protein